VSRHDSRQLGRLRSVKPSFIIQFGTTNPAISARNNTGILVVRVVQILYSALNGRALAVTVVRIADGDNGVMGIDCAKGKLPRRHRGDPT
jgi:hypothetical protein